VALSRASLELFEELIATDKLDFFYERKGLLHVYCSKETFSGAEAEQRELSSWGFIVRTLSGEETLSLEPAVSPRITGGLFVEGEAHGFCYGYVSSLASTLEKQGARIISGRAVSSISVKDGRVRGVFTASPDEEIRADLVVLAAGAWSARLARSVGIRIPLQPGKGYSCTVPRYPGSPRLPVFIPERRVIITPLADRLRFGGTLELAGFDSEIDASRYRAVADGARAVLRDPPPMENEEAWCGFRPVTPDGLPVIDRAAGTEGLIVATGHALLGFTQSPITGKLVAELAAGDPPSVPITPFRLDRF
jgi:D-amino-acid dehydrogenase